MEINENKIKNKEKNMEENHIPKHSIENNNKFNFINKIKNKFIHSENINHLTNKDKRKIKREKFLAAKKRNRIILITSGCLALIYGIGCVLFMFISYPRTIVADTDLSFHTTELMKNDLIPNSGEYELCTEGLNSNINIKGSDINYDFNVDEVVNRINSLKNPWLWPYEIFQMHDFMSDNIVSFNKDIALNLISNNINNHNSNAEKPVNADFSVDAQTKEISIKKEVKGNYLDEKKTTDKILGFIGSGRRYLELTEQEQQLPTLFSDNNKCQDALNNVKILIQSNINLQLAQTNVGTLNSNNWYDWIQLKEDYIAGLNEEKVIAWIDALANQVNTINKPRTFTTPYGKNCTVSGGDKIGWQIDNNGLLDLIVKQAPVGTAQTFQVPCISSMDSYLGPGTKDWGSRYIDVDLSSQIARMYDASGNLIWQSDIVSGKPGKNTPIGIYKIKAKKSPTTLIGLDNPSTGERGYRTEVQYWMGFVGDMIGFHDASWQPKFGGDLWKTKGSHGCVNLPTSAAAQLYNLCVSGDIVVVHN